VHREGHINNVMYVRYAESARVNWARNFAKYIDPENAERWNGLMGSKGKGLILRSMTTEYKFVCCTPTIPSFHWLSRKVFTF
jgi:acyl-CoA thioesterase FadM